MQGLIAGGAFLEGDLERIGKRDEMGFFWEGRLEEEDVHIRTISILPQHKLY